MQYDDLYKALADGHRREIVSALCEQPVVAGELARRVGLAPNTLSFHLKWLRSAGLIDMKRSGRHLWYHLNDSTLDAWRHHVNASFEPRLAPHRHHFSNQGEPAVAEPVSTRIFNMAIDESFLPAELL